MLNIKKFLDSFEIENLIITGAGFSHDAGLPLEKDVIPESKKIFGTKDPNFLNELSKRANELLSVENVFDLPIEEILTRVKLVEIYSRPPKDHYLDIKPVEQGILKLFSHLLKLPDPKKVPSIYFDFVKLFLQKSAFVTFNNDILLETIFDELKATWSYLIEENVIFDIENNSSYKKLSELNSDADIKNLSPFLKLHGSFNWHYCWECNTVRISSKKHFGVPITGIPELWFFILNCSNDSCSQPDGARPMLESLIIPPTHIKHYDLKFIQYLWTCYENFLQKAKRILVIGSSLRNEDALFLNSISNLDIKNPTLNEIVVINPDDGLVNKMKNLTNLNVLHFNNIEEYLDNK